MICPTKRRFFYFLSIWSLFNENVMTGGRFRVRWITRMRVAWYFFPFFFFFTLPLRPTPPPPAPFDSRYTRPDITYPPCVTWKIILKYTHAMYHKISRLYALCAFEYARFVRKRNSRIIFTFAPCTTGWVSGVLFVRSRQYETPRDRRRLVAYFSSRTPETCEQREQCSRKRIVANRITQTTRVFLHFAICG